MTKLTPRDWWKSYFSRNYARLYRGPLAPELATDSEIETLERIFSGVKAPVLDVGCGFGRHLGPLRGRRLPVYGVDWSAELLREVPRTHRRAVVRGDMRELPFRGAAFAGAYMLFNTFGYFEDGDNETVLGELHRVLRPGSRLVMDIPVRFGMKKATGEMPASLRVQEEYAIYENWTYDKERRRLRATGAWERRDERQDWELSLRLYTPLEIQRLLRRAGFQDEMEIRPLEDLELLLTSARVPEPRERMWQQQTNMVIAAVA